jgi:hypothetical protein
MAEEIVMRYGSGRQALDKDQIRLYLNTETVITIDSDKNGIVDFDEYRNGYLHCETEEKWECTKNNGKIEERYEEDKIRLTEKERQLTEEEKNDLIEKLKKGLFPKIYLNGMICGGNMLTIW